MSILRNVHNKVTLTTLHEHLMTLTSIIFIDEELNILFDIHDWNVGLKQAFLVSNNNAIVVTNNYYLLEPRP